jgi:hypothetical protein
MENKFEFKDLMNNILSGLLWGISIIMIVYLVNPEIDINIDWENIKNFIASLFALVIVFAFMPGIILAGFEGPFKIYCKRIFGDPYCMALDNPENKKTERLKRNQCNSFYNVVVPKIICENFSLEIVNKLLKLRLINRESDEAIKIALVDYYALLTKKNNCQLQNIGIMAERYVVIDKTEGPFIRFKNIKNLIESIYFPLVLTLILAKWTLFTSKDCCLYFLILVVIFMLFILRHNNYTETTSRMYSE